ncbi:MAG: ABC transporter ATP-binding protein [Caldiserica bacterium]|jgi:ABC-2 type transport system ATP-binding protein|nr:ABC transporter ATP-binding protein [Caldisericota bacterium]
MHTAIQVENLTRVFNQRGKAPFHALRGVSFDVSYGEIFGLLGPNGAGKTTTIKIMSTLLLPTSGSVAVAGFDVEKDYARVRPLISLISGGETSGYGILTVEEQLWMFSQFYGMETPVARSRIEEYLKVVGMWDSRRQQMNRLSTGMRQKVNLVRGLVTDPKVLFLDEPTLGVDVEASVIIRSIVRDWVQGKPERSVILTTHYMAEADELCSRVAIINHGLILANAAPSQLKQDLDSRAHYEITVDRLDGEQLGLITAFMGEGNDLVLGADKVTNSPMLVAHLMHESDIARLIAALAGQGATLEYMRKLEPTLEDAFLKMVGRRFEDEEAVSPVS